MPAESHLREEPAPTVVMAAARIDCVVAELIGPSHLDESARWRLAAELTQAQVILNGREPE
jgi:hypothetical protein